MAGKVLKKLLCGTGSSLAISFLAISLLAPVQFPSWAGTEPLLKEVGIDPARTLVKGDPIWMGGAEHRQSWRLFDLGGPMDLGFTLLFAPDLRLKSPVNEGRCQFPPWYAIMAFNSDSILRIVIFEDRRQEPYKSYANVFLSDDTLVFERDGTGAFRALGSRPFELKKTGDLYCLKDPYGQRVLFFRSRPLDMEWGPFWIGGAGEVTEIRDRNGNALTYTYNADNLPVRVADGLGRRLDLTYAEDPKIDNRNLLSVSDHTGRTVTFQYGPCIEGKSIRLDSFTAVDGRVTRFSYEMAGTNDCWLIEKVQLPEGNSHIDQDWNYSSFVPYLVKQRDAYGNELSLAQSSDAQGLSTVEVTEPGGAQTTFRHQDKRYPTGLTDAEAKSLQIGYDGSWRPTSLVDRLGASTSFSYETASGFPNLLTDASGNSWTVTYEARDQSFELPSSREESVTFTFHLPTCYAGPTGPCRQLEYDARGNAVSHTDQAGRTWTATYDTGGKVLTETNPAGAATTFSYFQDASLAGVDGPESDPVGFEYDTHGYFKRATFGGASSLEMARDVAGRVTSITDEENRVWSRQYDQNGSLEKSTDPASSFRMFEHDLMDRTSKITDRTGGVWERAFDSRGNLASLKDPTGLSALFAYDALGRLNGVTSGGETWMLAYDAEGIPVSQTSPLGLKTEYATDPLGRATSVKLPDGQTTLLERDAWGRITKVTDPLARATEYTYDPTGLLSGVAGPGASRAEFAYDGGGNLKSATDAGGNVWSFGRSSAGRVDSFTDPLDRVTNFAYDGRGFMSGVGYLGGQTLDISRDKSGRTTLRGYSGGPEIPYAYDPVGRLASTAGIELRRDAEGRITSTSDGSSAMGATYDAAGRLVSLDYGPLTVTYTYNPATGFPTSVSDSLTGTSVNLAWDKDGRLSGIGRPNGVDTTLTWDPASRLSGIKHGDLLDLSYSRDAAGQVTGVLITGGPDISGLLRASSVSFQYDAASQPAGDGFGSDSRGRATLNDGLTLMWDGASRALMVGGVTYEYNGASQPIRRKDGATDRKFQYHHALPGSPLAIERDASGGGALGYFIYDPAGNLLYGIDPGDGNRVFFYHFDAAGSTVMLTNSAGESTDRYAYDPFGALIGHHGTSGQPFTFNGQMGVRQEGPEGRIYRMGLRLYDAMAGRFVSREPLWPHLKEARSLNPYQFAFGNPLTFADPAGTDPEETSDRYAWLGGPVEGPNFNARPVLVNGAAQDAYFLYTDDMNQEVSWGNTYYWRIDETAEGPCNFLPVEDFGYGPFKWLSHYYHIVGQDVAGQSPPTPEEESAASRGLFYYQRFLDDGHAQPSCQQDAAAERPVRTGLFYMHRFLDDAPAQASTREAAQKVQGVWINVPLAGFRRFVPGGRIRTKDGDYDPFTNSVLTVTELLDPKTGRWEALDFQSQGGGASEGLGPAGGFVDHNWIGFWGN